MDWSAYPRCRRTRMTLATKATSSDAAVWRRSWYEIAGGRDSLPACATPSPGLYCRCTHGRVAVTVLPERIMCRVGSSHIGSTHVIGVPAANELAGLSAKPRQFLNPLTREAHLAEACNHNSPRCKQDIRPTPDNSHVFGYPRHYLTID